MSRSQFHIYNASAGSGKTFALVKFYLKTLFTVPYHNPHRKILSLTFTNKAVNEMKSRIIGALYQFSKPEILNSNDAMFNALLKELDWTAEKLHSKSRTRLESIVHDYSFFEVMTIDTFNQRLIRSFARDLGISTSFEIEMESEDILALAVDNLIAKAGTDPVLTNTLVGFAMDKSDDDKSFNIAYDFNKMAKILIEENHFSNLQHLKDKTLVDFNSFKQFLENKMNELEESIKGIAASILGRINELGIEESSFSNRSIPKHFNKLVNSDFNIDFSLAWVKNLDSKSLYPKRVSAAEAELIDSIQEEILTAFDQSRKLIGAYQQHQAIYKNLIPLSVLNLVRNEVELIKEEQNMVLISEFNPIVASHLQKQPAAFIYERIGERYKHFFIDEFQDTSVMQWNNMIPLIGNSLASEGSSAMLVGDAKQSIYRWRGGQPEQFIQLYKKTARPFPVEQKLKDLTHNFRSHREIVAFNNGFFSFLADTLFSDSVYGEVYGNCIQNPNKEEAGFVNLSFVEYDKKESSHELYGEQVYKSIKSCLDSGFELSDICILTRTRDQGRETAKYLSMNSPYEVVSADSLLLSHSPEVQFVLNIMQYLVDPLDLQIKFDFLNYLSARVDQPSQTHAFIQYALLADERELEGVLKTYAISFEFLEARVLPVYESIEYIIEAFGLMPHSDAYLQGLLDLVHEKSKTQSLTLHGFLEFFNEKSDKLGISLPSGIQAVQLMTIHQAKGLEFPVVIFPYADMSLHEERDAKTWIDLDKKEFNGFDKAYINFNKSLIEMGDWGANLYRTRREMQEFDTINILYVAFTRAVQRLHIISHLNMKADGSPSLNSVEGLLISYLQFRNRWSDSKDSFDFGSPTAKIQSEESASLSIFHAPFRMVKRADRKISISTRAGFLWDTKQQDAIEKGNLIHQIMADIRYPDDIPFAMEKTLNNGLISPNQYKTLLSVIKEIVNHPQIAAYYSAECTVYSERSILLPDGNIIRPDRVSVLPDKRAVLIDYKTGKLSETHLQQIQVYSEALEDMGLTVFKRFLIYIDEGIEVKEV